MALKLEFTVGSKYETKTNYRKLIQDFERTLVIETFANSRDTEATRIEIYVDDGHRIKDNGKGMTAYEFTEYNNVASLTKVKVPANWFCRRWRQNILR